MRGILVDILKSSRGSASGGGISEQCDRATLVLAEGGPFEPSPGKPPVRIVPGNLPGTVKAVSVLDEESSSRGGYVGPMFGGCYITGDSRVVHAIAAALVVGGMDPGEAASRARSVGPVPLHDRYETTEQYAGITAS